MGGMEDPSVYTHCWGGNLRGWVCANRSSGGVPMGMLVGVVFILGAVFHAWESLIL